MKAGPFKNEFVVGVFVLLALGVFFGITFIIRGTTGLSPYVIKAEFDNVAGLEIGSPVLVQGFRLGRVTAIEATKTSEKPTVIVTGKVSREITIYKNATVTLAQQGFIGDKRLEIDPGTISAGEIADEQQIESIPPIDMKQIFDQARQILDDVSVSVANLRALTSDEDRIKQIDSTLSNVNSVTERMKQFMDKNSEDLSKSIRALSEQTIALADKADRILSTVESKVTEIGDSASQLVAEVRESRADLTEKLEKIVNRADQVGTSADDLLTTSKTEVQELSASIQRASDNLGDLLEEINAGHGTVGRLIKDPKPFEDLRASISAIRSKIGEPDSEKIHDNTVRYRSSPGENDAAN